MQAAELPDYLPESLRLQARRIDIRKRQSLFRVNDPVAAIYFVRRGELEAVRHTSEGEALVMVRAGAGEFFGEPALAVECYTCAAHARVDSELFALPKAAVLASLQDDPGFAGAFLLAQIRNARRQCSRYERVRLRRAEDRIVHYLICEAGPDGRVALTGSLADWAAELGLQPESLYRALARLREDGRIEGEGTQLRVR
jgi:CRP/FNR family transcriptional regulator